MTTHVRTLSIFLIALLMSAGRLAADQTPSVEARFQKMQALKSDPEKYRKAVDDLRLELHHKIAAVENEQKRVHDQQRYEKWYRQELEHAAHTPSPQVPSAVASTPSTGGAAAVPSAPTQAQLATMPPEERRAIIEQRLAQVKAGNPERYQQLMQRRTAALEQRVQQRATSTGIPPNIIRQRLQQRMTLRARRQAMRNQAPGARRPSHPTTPGSARAPGAQQAQRRANGFPQKRPPTAAAGKPGGRQGAAVKPRQPSPARPAGVQPGGGASRPQSPAGQRPGRVRRGGGSRRR